MTRWVFRAAGALLALLACLDAVAQAPQAYPVRPLRIVIPFPPGGTVDFFARALGAKIAEITGQQVVVDNRSGGVTVIASEIVARANPDGYTIGIMGSGHAVNPYVFKSLPYDTEKDFQPVTLAIQYTDGRKKMVTLTLRLDTQAEIEYVKRGGILPYVLEGLAA